MYLDLCVSGVSDLTYQTPLLHSRIQAALPACLVQDNAAFQQNITCHSLLQSTCRQSLDVIVAYELYMLLRDQKDAGTAAETKNGW